MNKVDKLRLRIKSLNGRVFSSGDVRDGDDDVHKRLAVLVAGGEILAMEYHGNSLRQKYVYKEANLKPPQYANSRAPVKKTVEAARSYAHTMPEWARIWPEFFVPPKLEGRHHVYRGQE